MATILKGKKLTYVYQPNRLTEAHYDYTLFQERLLNYTMYYLQGYINQVINGNLVHQLDIFNNAGEEIEIRIPMGAITKPAQYKAVRENAGKLMGQLVKMKQKSKEGTPLEMYRPLFSAIGKPPDKQRTQELYLYIRKDVAYWMMHIDRNEGIAYSYTRFYWEVANHAKNKYTSRIYKILSSWQSKGATRAYSVEELKQILQLGNNYTYDILRRRVLDPVRAELKEMFEAGECDLYFEVAKLTTGRRVDQLSFKIITATTNERRAMLYKAVVKLLVEHFRFNDALLKQLDHVLTDTADYEAILNKIQYLYHRYTLEKNAIPHPQAWVIKSLTNEFAK